MQNSPAYIYMRPKPVSPMLLQTPESCVFIYSVSGNSWTQDCNGDVLADACAAGE